MAISEKVKNRLTEDCKIFYDKYKTLNELAVKKNCPSLADRIKKYYLNLPSLLKEFPDLPPDNGTRIQNFNNQYLGAGFPSQVDWSKVTTAQELIDNLTVFLWVDDPCENVLSETKEGIHYFFCQNLIGKSLF